MSQMIPDVLQMLRIDHKRLNDYFCQFDQSNDPRHKMSFAETALNELSVHSHLEEELFYPFVLEHCPQLADLIKANEADHNHIKDLLHRLETDEYSDEYATAFFTLAEAVTAHIETEENQLFPELNNIDLSEIAEQMNARRDELLRSHSERGRDFTPQWLLYMQDAPDKKAS